MLGKYFKIWKVLSQRTFAEITSTKLDAVSFIIAKLIRIAFLLVFLLGLFKHLGALAGYSISQVLLFYLIFNLMDVVTQAFFRGVYHMPPLIHKGNFDFFLAKPVSPLFLAMFWVFDFVDLFTLLPVAAALGFVIVKLDLVITAAVGLQTVLLFASSVAIVTALHIMAVAFMVRYLVTDSVIWVYRDLNVLARFPPEVYAPSFRFMFTFVIPIFIMMSFPAKALLGFLSWPHVLLAIGLAAGFLALSGVIWKQSLRHYSSASS